MSLSDLLTMIGLAVGLAVLLPGLLFSKAANRNENENAAPALRREDWTLPPATSREEAEWQRTSLLLVILDQQAQAEIRRQSGLRNARKAARLN